MLERLRMPAEVVAVAHHGWRLWAVSDWVPRIGAVLAEVERESHWLHTSKHARTRALRLPAAPPAYLKVYQHYGRLSVLKDVVRRSKAISSLAAGAALSGAGFPAVRVLVAGERRFLRVLLSAFVVTEEVRAPALHELLGDLAGRVETRRKRRLLEAVGRHVGRLHEAGFCHGDLVPANVRVGGDPRRPTIVLMDNDRTGRGRRSLSLLRGRRNLVQLNRFVVGGLTATDRWRVLRAYCKARDIDELNRRRLARWLIVKTARRRQLFDGVDGAREMSFRRLMMAPAAPVREREGIGSDPAARCKLDGQHP